MKEAKEKCPAPRPIKYMEIEHPFTGEEKSKMNGICNGAVSKRDNAAYFISIPFSK